MRACHILKKSTIQQSKISKAARPMGGGEGGRRGVGWEGREGDWLVGLEEKGGSERGCETLMVGLRVGEMRDVVKISFGFIFCVADAVNSHYSFQISSIFHVMYRYTDIPHGSPVSDQGCNN